MLKIAGYLDRFLILIIQGLKKSKALFPFGKFMMVVALINGYTIEPRFNVSGLTKGMYTVKSLYECFLGKVVQYEMIYEFPNIGRRDLFVSYFPIEVSSGIDRIACVLQDITERKLAQEALRSSEERFSKAFRNSPLAITISTEWEGRYLDVNDAFLEMIGAGGPHHL